jgi:tetratricopeptide (TPR) repeat protein
MRRILPLVVMLLATPAHADWWEARTDHFVVYSESSEADAKAFAFKLERFDGALRSLQPIKFKPIESDAQRVTVFRTGDTDAIGRLAGNPGVAGFYRPQLGGSVAFTPAKVSRIPERSLYTKDKRTDLDPQSVLFHEYAHSFMFQSFPGTYPGWYVEGFAETAATIVLNDDGTFHIGNPPQYRAEDLFYGMLTVNAEDLLASTDKPTFEDYYSHYTMGWLLNHYLTFEPSRAGQLPKYLKLIQSGVPSGDAAKQAFGDLKKLDRDILKYRNSGKLGGADVKPGKYSPPTVTMRRLTPDEEAIMPVKVRSKAGVSAKTSKGVAADARAIAARYPNSYAVQLGLAEAEFDADNLEAAERAADAAIAANPDSSTALLYKGMVLLERGKKDKSKLPLARPWFVKSYEADTFNPAPLFGSYMSFFYSGQPVPEAAIIGLERTYEEAPYDAGVGLYLARQLLSEKKGKLARSVLIRFALNPHESKFGKTMDEVVKLIDAGKVDDAYTKLAAELKKQEDEAEKAKKGG